MAKKLGGAKCDKGQKFKLKIEERGVEMQK